MKKAMLLIDRGSREPETKEELIQLCNLIKQNSEYFFVNYCSLEVIPPYIEEGIEKCLTVGADMIIAVPYFLYHGLKLKDSVKRVAKICYDKRIKVAITKPLSYHDILNQILIVRINSVKSVHKIMIPDKNCDILIIGHGSSDRSARNALVYSANKIKPYYRSVTFCFLELEEPRIESGINYIISNGSKMMIVVPYFLHKGTHVKKDIKNDISSALEKNTFEEIFITEHFGVDSKLVELILDRAIEVENKIG